MDALLEQAVQGMKKNGFEVVRIRPEGDGVVAARCIPAGARSLRMCP